MKSLIISAFVLLVPQVAMAEVTFDAQIPDEMGWVACFTLLGIIMAYRFTSAASRFLVLFFFGYWSYQVWKAFNDNALGEHVRELHLITSLAITLLTFFSCLAIWKRPDNR